MESKIIAIKNPENVCFKCLKKDVNIHNIKINEMGYGGGFDSWSTEIHLCNDCYNLTNSEWWKFETMPLEEEGIWSDCFKYKYEDEIFEFVENMPIEGKELFWNRYATGDMYCMDPQDWIDYELDILPHEKCKEYGKYSPQERLAYQDRFPICKHVEIKVYNDKPSHTRCYKGACGDEKGNCDESISKECYMCDCFEERNGEELKIVDVSEEFYKEFYKREIERLNNIIKNATEKLEKIKNRTLKKD